MRVMKDSGIEWIGAIPENWDVNQVGQCLEQVKCKNDGMVETNLLSLSYGKVKRRDIDARGGLLPETFEGYNIVEDGDIVLRFTDLQNDQRSLRTGLVTERGIITSAYTTVRPVEHEMARFLHYALHAYDVCKGFYGMGSGVRQGLNWQEAKYILLPMPSMAEMKRISDFLDDMCNKIDKAIEAAEKSIEDYRSHLIACVDEMVTGSAAQHIDTRVGTATVNLDLPQGWIYPKLIRILKMPITDGPHETPELFDSGVAFISASAIQDGVIDFTLKRGFISWEYHLECIKKYAPRIGDIYMVKSGATTGKVGMVETNELFDIWSPLAVIRCNSLVDNRFVFYALQASYFQKQVQLGWNYGTQQNLSMRTLENFRIALPNIDRQRQLSRNLDLKREQTLNVIAAKQSIIEDLKAYKQSLIYEVVTGKREV